MYRMYAVDPDTVAQSWQTFQNSAGRCGVESGRIIANFPDNNGGQSWEKIVLAKARSYALGDVEVARIATKLGSLRPSIHPCARRFNRGLPWLENVERAHGVSPWEAILTDDAACALAPALRTGDLDDHVGLFSLPADSTVARDGAAITNKLALLLAASSIVHIVDPYFMKSNTRAWAGPASTLVQQARQGPVRLVEAVIHTRVIVDGMGATMNRTDFHRHVSYALESGIPSGQRITVVRWDDRGRADGMHGRFLFTNIGGVRADPGFDAVAGGSVDLVRLSKERWDCCRRDFDHRNGGLYPIFDTIEVVGR